MNTLPIIPIGETADTVSPSRADCKILTDLVADASDLVDTSVVKAGLAAGETEAFPFELAERLLDGDHPITVFREHRGITAPRLAEAAGVLPSWLSEIENARKPGSLDMMAKVAAVLDVPLDLLVRQ